MRKIEVNEVINNDRNSTEFVTKIETVSRTDDVCTMWGIGAVELTEEHIEALQNGKCLYFTDGEYAHILYMER